MLRVAGEDEFKYLDVYQYRVPADSVGVVRSNGGGGWGDPLQRDPELVREDVAEEYVSMEVGCG